MVLFLEETIQKKKKKKKKKKRKRKKNQGHHQLKKPQNRGGALGWRWMVGRKKENKWNFIRTKNHNDVDVISIFEELDFLRFQTNSLGSQTKSSKKDGLQGRR